MGIEVQVNSRHRGRVEAGVLRNAAEVALKAADQSFGSLTILVTGDEDIRKLNQRFLGVDAPTDVLSFPSGDTSWEGEGLYLGDIMISIERAAEQAAVGGHSLIEELELLTVHGVLHLLGHDHADSEEKRAMWAVQAAALQALGNPLTPP